MLQHGKAVPLCDLLDHLAIHERNKTGMGPRSMPAPCATQPRNGSMTSNIQRSVNTVKPRLRQKRGLRVSAHRPAPARSVRDNCRSPQRTDL